MKYSIKISVTAILAMTLVICGLSVITNDEVYGAVKKPAKVKGVKVKYQNKTVDLKVSWKKAKRAKKYQIYFIGEKDKKWTKVTTKKRAVSIKTKANTKYTIKVRAINGKKKGKFSNYIYKSTLRAGNVGYMAPEVKAVSNDDGTISLSWNQLPDSVKHFEILACDSKGEYYYSKTTTSNSHIMDPAANRDYEISVTAVYKKTFVNKYNNVLNYSKATNLTAVAKPSNPKKSGEDLVANITEVKDSFTINGGEKLFFSSYNLPGPRVTILTLTSSDPEILLPYHGGSEVDWTSEQTYGVSDGTVLVTITLSNGQVYKYNVTVKGEDGYYSSYYKWRKQWIADNINDSMTTKEKVHSIASMICKDFSYANIHFAAGVYNRKSGSCLGGASMLHEFCEILEIPSTVRFAGNDLEKYNINYGQTTGHSNCFVWIDGEKYMVDATPGVIPMLFKWTYD